MRLTISLLAAIGLHGALFGVAAVFLSHAPAKDRRPTPVELEVEVIAARPDPIAEARARAGRRLRPPKSATSPVRPRIGRVERWHSVAIRRDPGAGGSALRRRCARHPRGRTVGLGVTVGAGHRRARVGRCGAGRGRCRSPPSPAIEQPQARLPDPQPAPPGRGDRPAQRPGSGRRNAGRDFAQPQLRPPAARSRGARGRSPLDVRAGARRGRAGLEPRRDPGPVLARRPLISRTRQSRSCSER